MYPTGELAGVLVFEFVVVEFDRALVVPGLVEVALVDGVLVAFVVVEVALTDVVFVEVVFVEVVFTVLASVVTFAPVVLCVIFVVGLLFGPQPTMVKKAKPETPRASAFRYGFI